MAINSFTLTNPVFDSIGSVLHPKPALANHSCNPNAFVRFDVPPASSAADLPIGGNISVHALRPIRKDEEITISYVDTIYPFDRRQQELKERYFFTCRCDLCALRRDSPRDRYYLPSTAAVQEDGEHTIDPEVAKVGNGAEEVFLGIESQAGLEYTQTDHIKSAMVQLAKSSSWPLYRYPWPQLRQRLFLGLLDSEQYFEALLNSATLVRMVNPIMFDQSYHPVPLIQMWTLWNLCRYCLNARMQNGNPSDKDRHEVRIFGLLSCVVLDEVVRALNDGVKVNGALERMVDEALENVKNEGIFWAEYSGDREGVSKASWAWIDNTIDAMLRDEQVSLDVITLSLVKQG